MILLDDDPKPQEHARGEQIQKLAIGIPTTFTDCILDVIFYGYGASSSQTMVGVEVKRGDDMADSITRGGRLAQQLKVAREFGVGPMYVVVQGIFRPSKGDGLLEELRGRTWTVTSPQIEYSRWDNFQTTLSSRGIIIKRSQDMYETARIVVDLYHWHQRPPEDHQSLDRFYEPVFLTGTAPMFRKVVKEFDGVGWTRSLDWFMEVQGKGLSIRDVLNQGPKEWAKTKGIGKKTALAIEEALLMPIMKV